MTERKNTRTEAEVAAAARARLDALAKPPGSLGRLEDLAVRLAVASDRLWPSLRWPRVIVFAGDHGVARAWPVSPYPPGVTRAMVHTFAAGRAAVASLARSAGASLEVVDCGVEGLGEVTAVDLRLSKVWTFKRWRLETFLDLLNVLHGTNPERAIYSYDYTETAYVEGLPLIPNLGFQAEVGF